MKKFIGLIAGVALLASALPVLAGKTSNMLTGGGMIVDGDYSVSFGGNIKEMGAELWKGQMQVNFHDVGEDEFDKGRFHSTEITTANWYSANAGTCVDTRAMNVAMDGKFNGEEGWSLIFRAGDNKDTVRIHLFDKDGNEVYDTSDGDFGDESSCFGNQRTDLDRGNLKIVVE